MLRTPGQPYVVTGPDSRYTDVSEDWVDLLCYPRLLGRGVELEPR